MPGKQPRAGEIPLSRQQSVIAAEILRTHFNPAVNTQMAPDVKNNLLKMVNDAFEEKGFTPTYSLRKMEDWRANCVYRWKCRQQKKKPECWGTDGRKRCRKARKSKEAGSTSAPGVAGGAIQKVTGCVNIHAEAFAQHMFLGDPMMAAIPNTNRMSLTINNSHTESFAVPSPIIPHNTSATPSFGSTRADEIMMIATNGSSSGSSNSTPAQNPGAAAGVPPRAAGPVNGITVKAELPQQTTWIAPSPEQSSLTIAPTTRTAAPPSLASVLDSNSALETSIPAIPVSPLAVSPPSSLGDQSIRDPADFDGMLGKSASKSEQQMAAEDLALMSATKPTLRSSLGGLGSPSWASFTAGAMSGMSPWAPLGFDSAMKRPPMVQPDGAGLATMAAIEEAASSGSSKSGGSMDPPPARLSSFGLTPLAAKSASQTNTPGIASLPKLSLSPAGNWLAGSYQSSGF